MTVDDRMGLETDLCAGRQADRHKKGRQIDTKKQADRHKDRQAGRHASIQRGKQADVLQIGRQTYGHTYIQADIQIGR